MTTMSQAAAIRIAAARNLRELAAALNALETDLEDYEALQVSDLVDTAGLPVFGGQEPRDTADIWSWDATHLLRHDSDRDDPWYLEPREDDPLPSSDS